jgi:hypothetical protein
MRGNGSISPKRILTLVMKNEQHEYLRYFECDKKYFDFVIEEYTKFKDRVTSIYSKNSHLESQKEFALAIMANTVYSIEQGVMFTMRKRNLTVDNVLNELGPDKIAKGMNLKAAFLKKFNIVVEEEV